MRYLMWPMLGQNGHLVKIGTVAPVLWQLGMHLQTLQFAEVAGLGWDSPMP